LLLQKFSLSFHQGTKPKILFFYSIQMAENNNKVNIEISKDLYDAIQQIKQVFSQLTGQQIEKDEDVIGILVTGFIESLIQQNEEQREKREIWWQENSIITE